MVKAETVMAKAKTVLRVLPKQTLGGCWFLLSAQCCFFQRDDFSAQRQKTDAEALHRTRSRKKNG